MKPRNDRIIPWEAKRGIRMECTERQRAIILGAILGDSQIEKRWKNPRIRFAHSIGQKDYLFWKYSELQSIASAKPSLIREKHLVMQKVYESWQFGTRALGEFVEYWNWFYPNGRKCVPERISKLMVSPLSLAVWYMDDGYKRNDCNAIRVSTDAFSQSDHIRLQRMPEENFGITSALHRKGAYWNIYIPQRSAKKFAELVRPYIVPTLEYKIALAP